MPNFFTKLFSRPPEPSVPQTPHVHSFELIAKTIAEPVGKNPEFTEETILGCTTYLWECAECGELRRAQLLGSEESALASILRKVDEQGPVSITRDGKRYLVGIVNEEPRQPGVLPVR
jgi:hypothetical protein